MIKKMTALLLALVLAVSCMPFTAYAAKSSITLEDAVDSDKYYFLSLNQIPSSALDISVDGYAQLWEITPGTTHSFKIH